VALYGVKDLFLNGATVKGFLMMESLFSLISSDGSFKLGAKLIFGNDKLSITAKQKNKINRNLFL
jgi:hypothetical protein